MTAHDGHGAHDEHHDAGEAPIAGGQALVRTVHILELLDNMAHVIVAVFFILMATTVIVHMGFIFARQLPLIGNPTPTPIAQEAPATGKTTVAGNAATAEAAGNGGAASKAGTAEMRPAEPPADDKFVRNSLELLSNILFVVILLELLRTIITYLQTHDIQAIMQEFLVVGIISSVRKILLVGAESSLTGSKGWDFIQESTGVLIDIMGILILIFGLVLLKRAFGAKAVSEAHAA